MKRALEQADQDRGHAEAAKRPQQRNGRSAVEAVTLVEGQAGDRRGRNERDSHGVETIEKGWGDPCSLWPSLWPSVFVLVRSFQMREPDYQ